MSAVKYQTMPPLSTEEYADLESSILANGIQVPIIVDEHGVVIDGHHRKAIAEQHGLHLPSETRHMLTEAQKIDLSIQLNIARRQLNREQKRSIVEAALKAQPETSNREHARQIGVSHNTVAAVRDDLEAGGQIDQLDKTVGADGKEYPASRPTPTVQDVRDIVGTYEEITVDPRTGEVLDDAAPEPVITEHTFTEKTKTTTGLDGKQYKRTEPAKPRRGSLVDDAYRANTELWKAIERVRTIRNDDRFTRNKADILTALKPSADLIQEILLDLYNIKE